MEVVMTNPFLVRKIFENLSIHDLNTCRFINKIFREEAVHQIKEIPVDSCSVYVEKTPENFLGLLPFGTKSYHFRRGSYHRFSDDFREKFKSFLNVDLCSVYVEETPENFLGLFLLDPESYHFRRGSYHRVSADFKDELKNFLNVDTRCLPSISFITHDAHLHKKMLHTMNSMTFNHPVVRITRLTHGLHPFIDPSIGFIGRQEPHVAEKVAILNAMHINPPTSDYKVILTDWCDPESERPNLDDPEFPIKSTILISDNWPLTVQIKDERHFGEFLKQTKINLSGGFFGTCSKLFGSWYPMDHCISFWSEEARRFKSESNSLSIAFAGKNVESAIFNIIRESSDPRIQDREEERLEKFKQNLHFPISDGRVFGFIFYDSVDSSNCSSETLEMIGEKFPSISFITLALNGFYQFDKHNFLYATLHLIRI